MSEAGSEEGRRCARKRCAEVRHGSTVVLGRGVAKRVSGWEEYKSLKC